jgi:hypothetical protein
MTVTYPKFYRPGLPAETRERRPLGFEGVDKEFDGRIEAAHTSPVPRGSATQNFSRPKAPKQS